MFRLMLSLALAIALGAIGAVAQTQNQVDRAKIEAFVDGAVHEAIRAEKIAGVSVAIVDRDGVVMARGYGAAAFDPPTARSTRIRSSALARSRRRRCGLLLSLDDRINDRLPPSLRIPDEGFRKPILVRHLMTHTAGFEDSNEGLYVYKPAKLLPLDESLVAYRVHRVREPGTLAVYSNYGAALAALLVAHIARSRGRTMPSGASCVR